MIMRMVSYNTQRIQKAKLTMRIFENARDSSINCYPAVVKLSFEQLLSTYHCILEPLKEFSFLYAEEVNAIMRI
jgi:hypothetical protein